MTAQGPLWRWAFGLGLAFLTLPTVRGQVVNLTLDPQLNVIVSPNAPTYATCTLNQPAPVADASGNFSFPITVNCSNGATASGSVQGKLDPTATASSVTQNQEVTLSSPVKESISANLTITYPQAPSGFNMTLALSAGINGSNLPTLQTCNGIYAGSGGSESASGVGTPLSQQASVSCSVNFIYEYAPVIPSLPQTGAGALLLEVSFYMPDAVAGRTYLENYNIYATYNTSCSPCGDAVSFVPGTAQPDSTVGLDASHTLHYQATVDYQLETAANAQLSLSLYDKPGAGRVLLGASNPVPIAKSDPPNSSKTLTIDLLYPLDGNPNPALNLPHTASNIYLVASIVNQGTSLVETSPQVIYSLLDLQPKIEVVQVVQDDSHNPVKLIRERNTVVRVYAMQTWASGSLVQGITGSLSARVLDSSGNVINTFPGPYQPAYNGSVTALNNDNPLDRTSQNNSLDFLLPETWVSQGAGAFQLELTAQLQPPPDHPVQSGRLTYTSNPPFSFATGAGVLSPFVVGYIRLCVNSGTVSNVCPTGGIAGMGRRMDDLYPVSPFGVLYTELPYFVNHGNGPVLPTWQGPLADSDRVLLINKLQALYLRRFQRLGVHKLVAWLPQAASQVIATNGPGSPIGQARIGGKAAWVLDRESSPLGTSRTLAHEVGHTLGLHHTGTNDPLAAAICTSSRDGNLPVGSPLGDWQTNGPYTNGTIQQPGFNTSGYPPAFDQQVLYYDLMNYCAAQSTWISPYHYRELYDSISSLVAEDQGGVFLGLSRNRVHKNATSAAPLTADYLLVGGSVSSGGSSGQLDPSEHITSTTSGDMPDPNGTYCVRQTDAGGKNQDFCFTPDFYDIDGNALTQAYFSYQIPYQPGAVRISLILSGGTALAAYPSAGPPVVTIQSPKPGGTLAGVPTLTWTATDPANAPLTYIVDYSTDGAKTWLPLSDTVASDPLTATQYTFDTTTLLSGPQIYFQVTAMNGLDSSTASVGPFTITNNPVVAVGSTALAFGNVTIGSATDLQVAVSNSGTGLLQVSTVTSDNASFRAQSGQMFIEAGDSETLVVTFVPTSTAVFSGNILINGGASAGGATIQVTGASFDHPVPNLTIAPAVLAFGSVQTGQTEDLTLTLGNSGNADLTVSQLSFTDARFLVVSPAVPLTVRAGATATLTLRFQPNKTGAASDALTIVSNDPSHGSVQVAVTGLGTASGGSGSGPQIAAGGVGNAADYVAKVSRGALAFAFGTNLAAQLSSAQTLPLPLTLGGVGVTVAGIPAPVFIVDPTFIEFQVPYEVPLGSSIPVVVTSNGAQSNTVNVTVADYALGVFTYNRTATIVDPDVFHLNGSLLTPSSPAVPGETVIVIANGIGKLNNPPATGAATAPPYPTAVDTPVVTVGGVAAVPQYSGLLAGDLGVVQMNIQLPTNLPSGSLPLVIQFPGDSSPVVNLYVQGNGTATPKIGVTPSSLSFGSVMVGQNSSLSLAVSNSGTTALTVNSITSSNGVFAATSPSTPFAVQPGSSTAVTVRFSPTSTGLQSGNLTISSNDPASPQFTVGVSGTGTALAAPSITTSPSTLAFGSVTVGKPQSLTLTINNVGTAALSVSSISVNNNLFTPGVKPASVAAGASFNLTVQFAPTAAGSQTGTLTVTSNDPAHPSVTVPLTGTGVAASAPTTVTLSVDGGSFNNTVGFQGAGNAVFVNRLTPPSYPATLTAIQIYFGNRANGLPVNTTFTLVAATNPSGSASFSATTLDVLNLYSAGIAGVGVFNVYTLPTPVTITSGDFVVGFLTQDLSGIFPADEDQITKSQGRSYVSTDGVDFAVVDSFGASVAGNFGIRAVVTLGGSP